MLQLSSVLNERALGTFKVADPGPIYEELCYKCPLQAIFGKAHHEAALKILATLAEYLANQKLEMKVRRQILSYMDTLGLLVEKYEKDFFSHKLEKISGAEVLAFLMEQHKLRQNDLTEELGSQSIVSEILSGKRRLNNNQILALCKRFGVSPAVFFP